MRPSDGARPAEVPSAEILNGTPAGAGGSVDEGRASGVWSLLTSKATSYVLWGALIALVLVMRFIAASALRDALRGDPPPPELARSN
jgi:hypothetical protein